MDIERVKTGIPVLDKMLGGGLIKHDAYIVSGGPGLGKSTLSMQFLLEGARSGEKVLYISLEEELEKHKRNMDSLGIGLSKALDSGNFKFVKTKPSAVRERLEGGMAPLITEIEEFKPSRIVFDSLSSFSIQYESEYKIRSRIEDLLFNTHKWGDLQERPTVLFTVDHTEEYKTSVEEFLVDGVIRLTSIQSGKEVNKALQIKKLRGSSFNANLMLYEIKKNQGITIHPDAALF